MLSKSRAVGCSDVVSLLEIKVLPKSVDNVVATLRSDVGATPWQRSANFCDNVTKS